MRRLWCLFLLGFGFFFAAMPATAQYIDEDRDLQDYTRSDHVSLSKPDWIGPYNWYYVPQNGYNIEVIKSGKFSNPGDIPKSHPKHPSNLPKQSCVIVNDKVGHPGKNIFDNPGDYGDSMACNPPIGESIPEQNRKQTGDRYAHFKTGDRSYPNANFVGGNSYVNKRRGGGYGEVVFTWNWTKRIVHTKLCDSITADTQQEILAKEGKYTDLSQREIAVEGKSLRADDINVEVNICRDDPTKKEPDKRAPYDTWREQSLAQTKCEKQVKKQYDTGFKIPFWSDYQDTWTKEVPEGWFRGLNEGFSKSKFMEWCITGGPNPFSPTPFPGVSKEKFNTNKAFEGNVGEDYSADVDKPWKKVGRLAGTTAEKEWAIRQCETLYDEITNRRDAAFLEMCKKEPLGGHFDGCWDKMQQCRGHKEGKVHVGVNQCCTDSHPQYHYHNYKKFAVPCEPFDMMAWEGNGAKRSAWESHDPDRYCADRNWLGICTDRVDGPLGEYYGPSVDGHLEITDGDRGFVGSNAILAPIGGDGEPMTVRAKGSKKIGTYFWFDLMSGNIGMRTFDESKNRQDVVLPATHKEAQGTEFWKAGNTIRGSDGGIFDDEDDISGQRGEYGTFDSDGKQKGWLYHLYFCERTFSEEEVKLMNRKWKKPAELLDQEKNDMCKEGEVYEFSEAQQEFTCMPESQFDGYGDGPPLVKWCAQCKDFDPADPLKRTRYGAERFFDHGSGDHRWCPNGNYVDWEWYSEKGASKLPNVSAALGNAKKCTYEPKGTGPPSNRAWTETADRYCTECDDVKPDSLSGNTSQDFCSEEDYDHWEKVPLNKDLDEYAPGGSYQLASFSNAEDDDGDGNRGSGGPTRCPEIEERNCDCDQPETLTCRELCKACGRGGPRQPNPKRYCQYTNPKQGPPGFLEERAWPDENGSYQWPPDPAYR
jgi:hypothetical protein